MVRRLLVFLLGLLVLTAGCARPKPQEPPPAYTNPVYVGVKDGLRESADPGPLKYNGEYFIYTTGDPCQIHKSRDLINWTYAGPMIEGRTNCWAPDVVYKNGTFYAYLSIIEPGQPEGTRRVRLFTSDKPEGPFVHKADLTDKYSYDAHYFEDDDSQAYLYWTQECVTMPVDPCAGNGTVVDKLVSMDRRAGELTRVLAPAIGDWECRGRCILEAPAVLKRDGQYFMQYSGAAYENDTYGGGSAVAQAPKGPQGPLDMSWVRQDQVLKSIEAKVDGPGGAAWVKGPNNLDDWAIYHARGITRETWERWLRIDPVLWGRDRFWVGASYEPQPVPAMPVFRDLFDSAALSKEWSTTGGQWAPAGGALRQSDTRGAATAMIKGYGAEYYVFEANLRRLPGSDHTGAAGVYAFYRDDKNYVLAVLEREAFVTTAVVDGSEPLTSSRPLPSGFIHEAYHQLLVHKNGNQYGFLLDGRPVGELSAVVAGPGHTGVVTMNTAAEFDGVALTHGWEDFFRWPPYGWSGCSGCWSEQDSTLLQCQNPVRCYTLKGPKDWASYEFTASVQGTDGRFGIVAAHADERNYAQVLLDPDNHTLTVKTVLKGKETVTPLALDQMDWTQFQTLRVTRQRSQFTVWLNGKRMHQFTAALDQGQPGLVTESAQARFDSVRAVRWE